MSRTRLLEPGDAPALADLVLANREFLAPWDPVRPESYFSVAGQAQVVREALLRRSAGGLYPAVVLDDHGAVVGRVNLNNIVRGPFRSASLGYWVAQSAGGRGLATAAVAEVVAIAFGELGLHRVEAATLVANHRSQSVLRRNGFEQYGHAPGYLSIAGRWADHLLFQKLAGD